MKTHIKTNTLRREMRLVGISIERMATKIGKSKRAVQYIFSKESTKLDTLADIVVVLKKAGSQLPLSYYIK